MTIKRKKFEDFATKRTNNAINHIRLIGKLANKNAYEYSNDDVNKIINALKKEVDAVKNKFLATKKGNEGDFSLWD